MSMPIKVTFLRALDGELEKAPILKFRLTYEGELRATQRDPCGNQSDPLAAHKHKIRQCFHSQLKHLWELNLFLSTYRLDPHTNIDARPIHMSGAFLSGNESDKILLKEHTANQFRENNYRFVPLVCEEFSLLCSLNILFLRRDVPGSAIQAGDIDNRVKTIIDALRKPNNANELRGNEIPQDGEDPFFCLLQDDKLVSHFAVETDTLLDEIHPGDADTRKAHVIITVALRPYLPTFFNLGLS